MNILPKKRWHVRTKQNIERVRRDEAKAAEEEKELKRRIELAEQEARTDLLRKRARIFVPSSEELSHSSKSNQNEEHVNFFKDIEETGKYIGGVNKEHEAEKKAEQEKFEKNIGLLTYLGESSVEAGSAPWYLQTTNRKSKQDVGNKSDDDDDDDTVNRKQKERMDPLNIMNQYLLPKKKKEDTGPLHIKNEKHGKEGKKCKDSRSKTQKKTFEQLRAERLEREKKERERSCQLLTKLTNGEEKEPEVIYDDRLRKYNSQFNPHLAKQSQLLPKQRHYDRNGYS